MAKAASEKHDYRLRYDYQFEPGYYKDREDKGLCDALAIFSLIFPEDGSVSLQIHSLDGRSGGPIHDADMFQMWAAMASHLAHSRLLNPECAQIAEDALNAFRKYMGTVPVGQKNAD